MSNQAIDGRSLRATHQRQNRRAEILKAALKTFGHNGYHSTHVSDIIEAAGVARGTFYLYFESKNAIFLELLDQMLTELRSNIIGVDTNPNTPAVELQLGATVRRLLTTLVNNRLLTNLIVREAVGVDMEVDSRLRDFYGSILQYIEEALDEGKRMKILREFDTKVAAMCVLGTIKQFMEHIVMMQPDDDVDIDAMALAVLDYNLRGVIGSNATT